MDLTPFKDIIKDRCGLSFDEVRTATLKNAVRERMSARGIESSSIYLFVLTSEQDEFNNLVNLVTVNETYFFREPSHLKLLTQRLVPKKLADGTPDRKIRILSAGCSTGEEPYSIALYLMEKYGAGINGFISVIGMDIDSGVIESAQSGVFGPNSFRDFPDNLREKYFEKYGHNRYKIKDFVRGKVEFRRLNLLADSYPEELKMLDIIFYRNVSIYFEPEMQRSIFTKLSGLLREDGYLFLSATETLSHNFGILSLVEMDGIFLFRKNHEQETRCRMQDVGMGINHCAAGIERTTYSPQRKTQSPARTADHASGIPHTQPDTRIIFEEALSLAKGKQYADALERIKAIPENDRFFIKACMLKAGILINMKKMEEAEIACMRGIEADRWCLEGHLLLGLIYKMRNDYENAIKRFREALYIQSSSWTAHFYLAEIYNSIGEPEKACREYEIAERLLIKGDAPDYGFTFFPTSFPAENMAHLCRHKIAELKNGNEAGKDRIRG